MCPKYYWQTTICELTFQPNSVIEHPNTRENNIDRFVTVCENHQTQFQSKVKIKNNCSPVGPI